jgi:hypothetical protein
VVHLLQRAVARLGYEKEGPYQGEQTEHGEEDVRAVACILDERGCDQTLFMSVLTMQNDM